MFVPLPALACAAKRLQQLAWALRSLSVLHSMLLLLQTS